MVGYSVYLGKEGDQLRQRRFFVNRSEAEKFVEERNTTPLPIGELWDRRTEILFNLERLRSVKSSLTDVVTFYLTTKFSQSDKKLCDVVTEFLDEKKRIGRSRLYDQTLRYAFTHFMKFIGDDLLLAIHVDRAGHLDGLAVPKKFQIKELCLWGWSKPKHAEIFVNSYVIGSAMGQQWFVPFPPPGFRSAG